MRQKTEDQSAKSTAKWLGRLAPDRLLGVSPRESCPDTSTDEGPGLFRKAFTWIAKKRIFERQPSDPSIAVLYPVPYQGIGLLGAAIVSGALLGLYGFFSLRL